MYIPHSSPPPIPSHPSHPIQVIDPKSKDFLRDVENAITFGSPILLQVIIMALVHYSAAGDQV
jgi:hypothetical protein